MAKKNKEELKEQYNTYQEYIDTFTDSFLATTFGQGIISEVDEETLKKYFSNPDKYHKELEKLAQYYYMANGEIFQLFNFAKILPTLNHKITTIDKSNKYENNLLKCKKALKQVKHKTLTRDLITQTITCGTLTGIWLGDKNKLYPFIFDEIEYAFPAYRKNGDWVVWIDLEWFDNMSETQRDTYLENLNPYVTKSDYDNYLKDKSGYKYIELPLERTICLRTHTLKRNQRLGTPWISQGLFPILHKKKLKDLEKSVANKIINSVAVLTIGNQELPNMKLNRTLKRKIYGGVKTALEKNNTQGVTCIAIPEYAELSFPEIKNSSHVLDPKKFESINDDISTANGISSGLVNGKGSNFASAKLNLDIFYKRMAVLLEDIEQEVYNKLFNLILPKSVRDEYEMVYDKKTPLTLKDEIDILMRLHNMEGFSLKSVIDLLSDIDFDEYVEQSIYEQEVLKLPEKIKPYSSAYIGNTSVDGAGRPLNDDSENDNTIKSKTSDGNNIPE